MRRFPLRLIFTAVALATVLAACGGGSGDADLPPPPDRLPSLRDTVSFGDSVETAPESDPEADPTPDEAGAKASEVRCDPNYTPCVPIDSDVDCEGGRGNGPSYVAGPVEVIGDDVYRLDADHDGVGCEG